MNYQEYDKDLERALEMERESQEQIDLVIEMSEKYNIEVAEIKKDLGNTQADNEQLKNPIIFEE
jgi:hypothetical protein